MAGALIVEGDFADVPEIAQRRRSGCWSSTRCSSTIWDTIEHYDTVWPEAVPRFLSVNGQREPIIRMRPGEVQRWRIVHAGHEDNLRLALDGHALHAIAYDGIPLPQVERYETLVIAPGQRVDVLVQAGAPGTYLLGRSPTTRAIPRRPDHWRSVVVEGEPLPMGLPATLPAPPLAPSATTS